MPRPAPPPARGDWLRRRWVKPALWLLCLLPLAWLVAAAALGLLGANPAEALERGLGLWTLRLLCLALALTPLRVWLRLPALARLRRPLGLFVAFYALLHLLAWAWFDWGLEPGQMLADVAKRPFILLGTLAFALLAMLALTSFAAAQRRLGARRWQRLHRGVYLVALLALLHFYWMRLGKNDVAQVQVYAFIVAALLLARVAHWWRVYVSRRSVR